MTTSLGTLVKSALDERGISQAELSRRTGVPVTIISHIVHDRRGAGADYATRLGAELGLEPGVFDTRATKRKAAADAAAKAATRKARRPTSKAA